MPVGPRTAPRSLPTAVRHCWHPALLNRLNPYKGLNDTDKRALIAEFRQQEESFGNRDIRMAKLP